MSCALVAASWRNRADRMNIYYKGDLFDWLTGHRLGSPRMTVYMLKGLKALYQLSHKTEFLRHPRPMLKAWDSLGQSALEGQGV